MSTSPRDSGDCDPAGPVSPTRDGPERARIDGASQATPEQEP